MSNKFCRLLSNGYKINIDSGNMLWSPCCFYSKKTDINDREAFEKELKYTSSATGWLPECSLCQDMENSGVAGLSPRINSFARIPEEFDDGDCVDLEISFDTRCNAACITCGPYASSTWAKFNKKHGLPSSEVDIEHFKKLDDTKRRMYNEFLKIPLTSDNTSVSDVYLHKLIEIVPMDKLRNVFMMGGEPFFTDTHIKLMNHILSVHPCPEKITLSYQTNGGIYPSQELFDIWSNFGRLIISLSIDGVGERFNYTRWPLRWDKVHENVVKFVNCGFPNIKLGVNMTLSPINFWYYDELSNWIIETIPENMWKVQGMNRMNRPNRALGDPLDLDRTPMALRNAFYTQFGVDHPVSMVLKTLPDNSSANMDNMISHIDRIDKLRGLYWREIFPDTAKFFPPPIV